MRNNLALMLLGVGIGVGATAAYQQYANGNMKKAFDNLANKAQKSQGNMM